MPFAISPASIVKSATFNGFNLVDGSTTQVTALASTDGSRRITASAENMSLSGSIVTMSTAASVSTQASASYSNHPGLAHQRRLGAGEAVLGLQEVLGPARLHVEALQNSLTAGVGNLVDANMATESALLQSLQVKQQLGVQALSIANQAPRYILSLFK